MSLSARIYTALFVSSAFQINRIFDQSIFKDGRRTHGSRDVDIPLIARVEGGIAMQCPSLI
jgi:hypothetical protein